MERGNMASTIYYLHQLRAWHLRKKIVFIKGMAHTSESLTTKQMSNKQILAIRQPILCCFHNDAFTVIETDRCVIERHRSAQENVYQVWYIHKCIVIHFEHKFNCKSEEGCHNRFKDTGNSSYLCHHSCLSPI